MEFTEKEKRAILSIASDIMFADSIATEIERNSYCHLQQMIGHKLPPDLMFFEEGVDILQKKDALTKARILLAIHEIAISDGIFNDKELSKINKIWTLFNLPTSNIGKYHFLCQSIINGDVEETIPFISSLEDIEKCVFAFVLQQTVSKDGVYNENEKEILSNVFGCTGISELFVPEKTGFLKRIFG